MQIYNVRWKDSGNWVTQEGAEAAGIVLTGDIMFLHRGPEGLLPLRVLQRVLTEPVTLICAKCVNPFEDVIE